MEDKAAFEKAKEMVARAIDVIPSGMADLEKVAVIIDLVESVAETFKTQTDYRTFRKEQPGDDLPSEEELQSLNDLISTARELIDQERKIAGDTLENE